MAAGVSSIRGVSNFRGWEKEYMCFTTIRGQLPGPQCKSTRDQKGDPDRAWRGTETCPHECVHSSWGTRCKSGHAWVGFSFCLQVWADVRRWKELKKFPLGPRRNWHLPALKQPWNRDQAFLYAAVDTRLLELNPNKQQRKIQTPSEETNSKMKMTRISRRHT